MDQAVKVPIEVSAKHVHLTQAHVDLLFGEGYQLKHKRELSQKGYYVAEEKVQVIGEKSAAMFSILTPLRGQTQVEVSVTDAIKLGLNQCIRMSGDLAGSASCRLKGPMGEVELKEGVIVAMRHIHLNDQLGLELGIKNNDAVSVKVGGERGVVFKNVIVRTDPSFDITMHVDTDEGNAIQSSDQASTYGTLINTKKN